MAAKFGLLVFSYRFPYLIATALLHLAFSYFVQCSFQPGLHSLQLTCCYLAFSYFAHCSNHRFAQLLATVLLHLVFSYFVQCSLPVVFSHTFSLQLWCCYIQLSAILSNVVFSHRFAQLVATMLLHLAFSCFVQCSFQPQTCLAYSYCAATFSFQQFCPLQFLAIYLLSLQLPCCQISYQLFCLMQFLATNLLNLYTVLLHLALCYSICFFLNF